MAGAVSYVNANDRDHLYRQLLEVAKKRTALADIQLGEDGKPIEQTGEQTEDDDLDLGENVIIVKRETVEQ